MSEELFEHTDTLLLGIQKEVADSELSYKLRTVRQLLVTIEEQHTAAREALEEADVNEETLESLRQLGYLD